MDPASIKIKLFKIVDSDLDDLFKKEAFHKNTTSTSSILDEELESLEENFTVDEGFDFIMNEELDDISYKQNEKHKHLFLYDDNNSSVVNAFEIEDLSSIHSKNLLGKFYSVLPIKVSDILDLHVFGNLTYNEIAEVKNIETKRVERVISLVMEAFKSI